MPKPRHHVIAFAAAILLTAHVPAEEERGRSRLKLEPAAEVPAHHAIADPYDDLGDFVATYTVRRRRSLGNPVSGEEVNWGFYQAARRGDWSSMVYELEGPDYSPEDSSLQTRREREAWIWFRGRFEGVINNNILTLDPSDTFVDGPLPPFVAGLGWIIDGTNQERPILAPPNTDHEAWLASLGWGTATTTSLGDGNVEERRLMTHPIGTLDDGTQIVRYLRKVRKANPAADEVRSFLLEEHGVRIAPADGASAFDLPYGSVRVGSWKGKLPQEIHFIRYRLPEVSEDTRQELASRLDRLGAIDTILSEYRLLLTDVRSPAPGDLIEMNDFRPKIAAIRDGRHDAPLEDVTEHAHDGTEVTKWALDENSQMWSRVAAP